MGIIDGGSTVISNNAQALNKNACHYVHCTRQSGLIFLQLLQVKSG
jgi:hypothetical protein